MLTRAGYLYFFLGGMRFPVYLLPGWMQALSMAIPLAWSLDIVRRVLVEGASLSDVLGSLGMASVVSAVCFALAYANLTRSERQARERGTLVLY